MKREKYTEKLIRMIAAVEAGSLPAKVNELYVFGSYARGALEPGDLDVVVIYEWPPKNTRDAWIEALMKRGLGYSEAVRRMAQWVTATMRAALRRPGERVHLLLEQSLDYVVEGTAIQRSALFSCGHNTIAIGVPS